MIRNSQSSNSLDWAMALRASVVKLIDETGPDAFVHPANWAAHMVVGAFSQ
ncbi:MAG: hypothetical protein ABJQ85_22095 [Rhizobiaceae bacterium]